MKNIPLLLLVICLVALNSCSKELPYPDADATDVLVMNGLLSPETGAIVYLSQSCHITDRNCNQKTIETAQVMLKDESGNDLVELTHDLNGIYKADGYQVLHNKKYTIEAKNAGFEPIKSKASVPNPFNCSLTDQGEAMIANYVCWTFEIEIEDNPEETNYYLIDGWIDILNGNHEEFNNELNGFSVPHSGFITNDINAENNTLISPVDIVAYPLSFVFLKDDSFNGQTYQLEFGLVEEDTRYDKDFELEAHIRVKSASKELYDYYKSVTTYKLTSSNILSEPQQIFSNIEKGIGIFAGFTEREFVVDLPQTEFYPATDILFENAGCTSPCTVQFFADIGDQVNFIWDFGDGNTSTEENPEHQYQAPGNYLVSLNMSLGQSSYVYSAEVEIF